MMISGDWDRLQATIRGLRKLAEVPSKVAADGAIAIKAEIDASFDSATDPYGHRWAPLMPATIKRWGKHPILQLTGDGRSQITVQPMPGAGISVESPSLGLAFAQGGTANEETRRFLPVDQFPRTWRLALERSAESRVQEALADAG